jgi:hypothetical protein
VNRRAAGSDRQFRTRSSKVFACQVMRNVVQGPPGCYECVRIISSQELTMNWRSNQRYDIVDDTSLLQRILFLRPYVPILGTKPSGRAQSPKFASTRCVRINWRRETRRREEGLVVVLIDIDADLQLMVKSIAFSLHPPKHRCCSSSTLDQQFVA